MENYGNEMDDAGYTIDISNTIINVLGGLKKYCWLILLLALLSSAISCIWMKKSYTPQYTAAATFTVNLNSSSVGGIYEDRLRAAQMSATFPYIITSGVLKHIIAVDLGVEAISEMITADNVEGTNLFTIKVTSGQSKRAYAILQSVIKNYPQVAETVVGSTHLNMIEETGIPKETSNRFSYSGSFSIGALSGTILGLLFILLYALTRKTIHKPEDLTDLVNMKNLGTLPHVALKRRSKENKENSRISLLNEKISLSYKEDIYKIWTRAEKIIKNREMKVILVTSALPGEGKSTFSFNLSLAMAEEEKRVLLIDCDFHRPFIKDMISSTDYAFGLDDVVKGIVSLKDAIQYHEKLKISVLACSRTVDNASEILGTRIMYDFIDGLKRVYDYIILDTAPSAILADTLDLAKTADGAIFIIKQDFSTIHPIMEALEHLTESSSVEMIGFVLNDVNTMLGNYGLGYYGKYGSYQYHNKKRMHKLIKEED